MRSRKNNLRTACVIKYIHDICSDTITTSIGFLWNLLSRRKDTFCVTQINNNVITVKTLNNSVYDFTFPGNKAGINRIPFSILHFLDNDLLGRLGSYATESGSIHF